MAGMIFISRELRVAVSTQQLGYLVERIRDAFSAEDLPYLLAIYSPMDDEGMNFISVENEDENGLKAFFKAVVRAKARAGTESNFGVYVPLWQNLLAKIRMDSRFSPEWERSDGD